MKNKALWKKIQAFEFDDPSAGFSFSNRLASENHWSSEFTLRVIEEYRKFLYLCCASDFSITPSREVDEAWHLHLCYTKSYWEDLCSNTLGRKLHHGPTKGGRFERAKFIDWYEGTKKNYLLEFMEKPPADIWPSSELRFSPEKIRKVNQQNHLIIPKRPLFLGLGILGTSLILSSCTIVEAGGSAIIAGLFILIIIIGFRGGRGGGGNGSGGCSSGGGFFGGGCGNSDDGGGCSSGCGGGGCGGA